MKEITYIHVHEQNFSKKKKGQRHISRLKLSVLHQKHHEEQVEVLGKDKIINTCQNSILSASWEQLQFFGSFQSTVWRRFIHADGKCFANASLRFKRCIYFGQLFLCLCILSKNGYLFHRLSPTLLQIETADHHITVNMSICAIECHYIR